MMTEHTPQRDSFLLQLAGIINPRHELVALARTIFWDRCERELIDLYADVYRPGASLRLLVSLSPLKYTYALSDKGCRPALWPTPGRGGHEAPASADRSGRRGSGTINRDSFRVVSADTT